MKIVGSLILFIIFIFAYLVVVEVFVILFKLTGLDDEKARFQVVSMLTNSGYTTQEAEIVVHSRTRRKLARFVMLFGYAFTVTIVSTVVNIFLQFRNTYIGGAVALIPMFITLCVIVIFIKRNKFINNMINKIIERLAQRLIYHGISNRILIIEKFRDIIIAKVEINIMPKELDDKTLQESQIKQQYGINVLFKKQEKGELMPTAETKFKLGDIVVVMGAEENIKRFFNVKEDEIDEKDMIKDGDDFLD